jgi:hypothetical protein
MTQGAAAHCAKPSDVGPRSLGRAGQGRITWNYPIPARSWHGHSPQIGHPICSPRSIGRPLANLRISDVPLDGKTDPAVATPDWQQKKVSSGLTIERDASHDAPAKIVCQGGQKFLHWARRLGVDRVRPAVGPFGLGGINTRSKDTRCDSSNFLSSIGSGVRFLASSLRMQQRRLDPSHEQ